MKLRRRLCTALAIATLTLGLFGSGSATASNYTACAYTASTPNQTYFHQVGTYAGATINGISATIDPDAGFRSCIWGPTYTGSSSVWVAVDAPCCNFNESAILQIGLLDYNGSRYWFMALGGCNGAVATAKTLPGSPTLGAYTYAIQLINGNYQLSINNVIEAIIPATDSRISCWASGTRDWTFSGERHNVRDGLGSTNPATRLYSMEFYYSSAFHLITPACQGGGGGAYCTIGGNHDLLIWTIY